MKENARKGDSFKKLTNEWTIDVENRMKLEQRLLFLEFQKRGGRPTEGELRKNKKEKKEKKGGTGVQWGQYVNIEGMFLLNESLKRWRFGRISSKIGENEYTWV